MLHVLLRVLIPFILACALFSDVKVFGAEEGETQVLLQVGESVPTYAGKVFELRREYSSMDAIQMWGRIGDHVLIPEGNYIIWVYWNSNVSLYAEITVNKNGSHIRKLNHHYSCGSHYELIVKWVAKFWTDPKGVQHIEMGEPTTKRGFEHIACEISMLRPQHAMRLRVSSEPAGAEIFVGKESVGETDADLSVPFIGDEGNMVTLVVRKQGYVNCVQRITTMRVHPPIHCQLSPL